MFKIREILRTRWKWLTCIALLGILIMAFFFFPNNSQDLSKYQALIKRGEVDLCRVELSKALEKRPEWHEGRAFLAELEIKSMDYGSATRHLIILTRAGWDTRKLENALSIYWSEIQEELERAFDPDWHWPRLFYIRSALFKREHTAALTQLAILADLQEDITSLENLFLAQVQQHDIAALIDSLDASDSWSQVFALRMAIKQSDNEITAKAFQLLLEAQPSHPLLGSVRQLALNSNNYVLSWQLSMLSGSDIENVLTKLYALERYDLETQLSLLQGNHPELSALRCFAAAKPLPALLELEKTGYTPLFRDLYAQKKLSFIHDDYRLVSPQWLEFIQIEDLQNFHSSRKDTLNFLLVVANALPGESPELQEYRDGLFNELIESDGLLKPMIIPHRYLSNYSPQELWNLAMSWQDNPDSENGEAAVKNIFDYLANVPHYSTYVAYFSKMLNPPAPPAPDKTIPLTNFPGFSPSWGAWSLCPNARYLIYAAYGSFYGSDITLVDLNSYQRVILERATAGWFSPNAWSPDSEYVAVEIDKGLRIYKLSNLSVFATLDKANSLIGWLDNSTLYYYQFKGEQKQVFRYSVSAKKSNPVGTPQSGRPTLSPKGELAWIVTSDNQTKITIGDSVYSLSTNADTYTYIASWLPNDGGLVLNTSNHNPESQTDSSTKFIHFPQGNITELMVPRFTPSLWLDQHRAFGFFIIRQGFDEYYSLYSYQLALLDITDMSLSAFGSDGKLSGNHLSSFDEENFLVYKLK